MVHLAKVFFGWAASSAAIAADVHLSFYDDARKGLLGNSREVKVKLYYPEVPQDSPLPLVVFAHCLMGAGDWYDYLGNALAEEGYVMATLETNEYFPSDTDFMAPDMAFALDELRRQSREVPDFQLYGKLEGGKAAAAGHSLGGVSSFYAVNKDAAILNGHYTADFDAIFTVSACCGDDDDGPGVCGGRPMPEDGLLSNMRIPSLQLTGTKDCLCPPSIVAEPFFKDIASDCKYLVDITGATHCQFATASGPLGPAGDAAFCGGEAAMCAMRPDISHDDAISLEEQEEITTRYALAWFDWTLRGNMDSLASLNSMLSGDAGQGTATYQVTNDGCPAPLAKVV